MDSWTDGERDKQIEMDINNQMDRLMDSWTDGQTDRQIEREIMDMWTDRWVKSPMGCWTDGETDR